MKLELRPALRRAGPWLLAAAALAPAPAAQAVVQGQASGLDHHVVRIAGGAVCTGVAIDRRTVVTAAHCPSGGVHAGGAVIGVAARLRGTVTLDNGQRVTLAGDSAILRLRAPLPASISPLPVADAEHDGPYLIAGYGTPSETHRSYGALREALLVDSKVERHMLVDPNRSGAISASACFGDSGGPVLQRGAGGWRLVGVITRANYPNRRIACGFYTRYAPVRASGTATAAAAAPQMESFALAASAPASAPAPKTAPKRAPQKSAQAKKKEPEAGPFSRWLARVQARR